MASPTLDIAVGIDMLTGSWTNVPLIASMPITDVKLPGGEIEVHNSSHQGLRGTNAHAAQTFIPADLYDCGTFECTVQHKQDDDFYAEIGKTEVAARINLPHNTNCYLTFAAIIQSYQPQNTTLNEPMLADVVVKVNGDVAPTTAA